MEFPNWQLHRGYWKKGVRENTMEAFREAKKSHCEMVEMDVQVSKDGVPHIFHDFTLKKFFHIDEALKKQKSEDLSALNIPKLAEVLDSDEVPHFLNIELKSIDLICLSFTKKICQVIKEKGEDKTILLSSFNPMCLFWAKRFLPDVPRALIIGDKAALFDWKFSISMKMSSPQFINPKYRLIEDEKALTKLLRYGLPFMVWTVNDEAVAKSYLEEDLAYSIISDLAPISILH